MLETTTGEPYLIDFGSAARIPLGVYEDVYEVQALGERVVFSRDRALLTYLSILTTGGTEGTR